MLLIKSALRCFAAVLCVSTLMAHAAEPFPSRTVSVVVGFPAGGATDVSARAMVPTLQRLLGQPVIVENVPGAGGSLGVQKALRAPPDGHTVFHGTASDTVLTPLAFASARYQAENLRLVAVTGTTDFALLARPGLEIQSVADLVAHVRKKGSRELSYASFGIGAANHLVMEEFRRKLGAAMIHAPYKGMAPVVSDLMGNQVDLAFFPVAGPVVAAIRAGKIRALMVTSSKRNPQLPDIPAADEVQAFKGFHFDIWLGVFVPASTPLKATASLHAAVTEAVKTPEFQQFSQTNGLTVPATMDLDHASRFYAAETARYRSIARSIRLEPQ